MRISLKLFGIATLLRARACANRKSADNRFRGPRGRGRNYHGFKCAGRFDNRASCGIVVKVRAKRGSRRTCASAAGIGRQVLRAGSLDARSPPIASRSPRRLSDARPVPSPDRGAVGRAAGFFLAIGASLRLACAAVRIRRNSDPGLSDSGLRRTGDGISGSRAKSFVAISSQPLDAAEFGGRPWWW
jgi:hypothetical protein